MSKSIKTIHNHELIKITTTLLLFMLLTMNISSAEVEANPGVHVNVPHSPIAVGQPVYIEYHTAFGEDGTIDFSITKPPLLAIFWQAGPLPIQGGLLYDISAPGMNTLGTYTITATVTLTASGTIHTQATFEVVDPEPMPTGPLFDFTISISPPSSEIESGGTAHYNIHITYSDPSHSGTAINIELHDLPPDMTWHSTPTGELTINTPPTTPPGTYAFTLIGLVQNLQHHTSATLIVTQAPQHETPPHEEPPPEELPQQEPPSQEPPPREPHREQVPDESDRRLVEEYRPPERDSWGDRDYLMLMLLVVFVIISAAALMSRKKIINH